MRKLDTNNRRLAYVLIFLVECGYGIYPVFVRWSGLAGKEQYVAFWRMVFALAVIAPLAIAYGKVSSPSLKKPAVLVQLIVAGACIALQTYLFSRAVDQIPVSDALFLFQLAPVIVALAAPFLLKEKLEGRTVAALAIALAGLAFICFVQTSGSGKSLNAAGAAYAVVGAFFFAGMIMFIKSLRESLDSLTIMLYGFSVAALVILPFTGFHLPPVDGGGWASLAVLGAFHTGLLGLLYIYLAKTVKAQHMGVAAYVEPVAGTVFAMIFFAEMPGWSTYVGGALIIAAGLLIILSQPSGEPSVEQTASAG